MPFQEVFHHRMALKGLVAGFHTGYFAWEVGLGGGGGGGGGKRRGNYVHRPQKQQQKQQLSLSHIQQNNRIIL